MKLTRPLLAVAILAAGAARAEVSVDHVDGGVVPWFEASARGPWSRVRPEVPLKDLLNPEGDAAGDAWPAILVNPATGLPEVAWATGGAGEVQLARWEGEGWMAPRNLSRHAGSDEMVVFRIDASGNRFLAWDRLVGERHAVEVTAVSIDRDRQSTILELSQRPRAGRAPAIDLDGDDLLVGYEEWSSGSDPRPSVTFDRIVFPRDEKGALLCGGEIPIDIVRRCGYRTRLAAGDSPDVTVTGAGTGPYATWVDAPGILAVLDLSGSSCNEPDLRAFDPRIGPGPLREALAMERGP